MSSGLDLSQFYETFFDEADELLTEMEQLLLELDVGAPDVERLNAIFRVAHSIKGGAATFGCFTELAQTTHLLENLLDGIRRGEMVLRADMIDIFLQTKDVLKSQLDAFRAGAKPDAAAYESICAVLKQLAQERFAAKTISDATLTPVAAPSAAADEPGKTSALPVRVHIKKVSPKDAQSLRDEMAILGQVLATEQTADSLTVWLESTVSIDDIEAVCCFIVDAEQLSITQQALPAQEIEAFAQAAAEFSAQTLASTGVSAKEHVASIQPTPTSQVGRVARPVAEFNSSADKESASIRVNVEKVDQVINLVGELVITQAMLAQTASTLDPVLHDRLLNGMEQLQRNARDLQDAVMSIRMIPIDYVFSRFPRLVRDMAGKMGKQIELHTHGRSTELDKSLIERIIDPLTHLVRNSLDHGIERPDQRLAAGKDAVGHLVLSAQHNGGSIVIEVSDDGAGLNRQKILEKARAHGISVHENMPDEEVWQLIFAPGFSTADQVTDISGRGVGMDVVRRNIHDMGGHVLLSCVPGEGTTTRIVLPLTLAILDGMAVHVGEETFILPLSHVTESLQPTHEQLYWLAGNERVMQVRGEYLPLVETHKLFSIANAQTDPTHAIAVIIQAEEHRFALMVDQLIGQHQVVVKNLESNYRKVPGISAATILGDGSVALIIDVFAVARAHGGELVAA